MSETKKTFEPITSQDALDAIIRKRLKADKDLEAELAAKNEELAAIKREHARTISEMTLKSELASRGIRDETKQARIRKLIDLEGEQDVPTQLDGLSKEVPELFRIPRGAGSGGSSQPVLPKEEELTREDLESMSPDEINTRWDSVRKFLAGERS